MGGRRTAGLFRKGSGASLEKKFADCDSPTLPVEQICCCSDSYPSDAEHLLFWQGDRLEGRQYTKKSDM